MPKVSVIIPVYNGEEHLRECMDSVCGQTLADIEILCVDDGSADASPEILEEYRKKDERVKIFRQSNQYAGAARNRGIEEARGEYLAFWDCDDYFEKQCLERMYEKAAQYGADICVCSGNQYYTDQDCLLPNPRDLVEDMLPEQEPFSMENIPDHILNFTIIPAWNKLYCRTFVMDKHLRFGDIRIGEDVYFTVQALALASSIVTVKEYLVNYRTSQGNSLVDHMAENASEVVDIWMTTADELRKKGRFPQKSFANRSLESMLFLLQHVGQWEVFADTVRLLKEGGIAKLGITDEEGYYYNPRHQLFAEHLVNDTPEQLLAFLSNSNFERMRSAGAARRVINQRYKRRGRRIKRLEEEKQQLIEEIASLKRELEEKKHKHFWQK